MILYYQIFRGLTADEVVLDGLRTGKGPDLEILTTEATGRGVVAAESISKGQFACKYKTSRVYDVKQRTAEEACHSRNSLGCFIIETKHAVPGFCHLCFDASERFHHPGRYINHVAKGPQREAYETVRGQGKSVHWVPRPQGHSRGRGTLLRLWRSERWGVDEEGKAGGGEGGARSH